MPTIEPTPAYIPTSPIREARLSEDQVNEVIASLTRDIYHVVPDLQTHQLSALSQHIERVLISLT